MLKPQAHTLLLALLLPGLPIAATQANGFEYSPSPNFPNRVLLESNLSFDGISLTYGHIYTSIYELTDMDGDDLPERAFMITEPGVSCLTLVYVPSTQLWRGDISSNDLSEFARVRNIGYPYFSSSDAACQIPQIALQRAEGDLHLEAIADISGDGKRDFLINDFEFVPTILVSGDLVPGVVYDASNTDSHIATYIPNGYVNTVLEDVDQDALGEIAIAWAPETDREQTTSQTSECGIYSGGIGNFPPTLEKQDFSTENTLSFESRELCSYARNIGDINGDQVQDLIIEESQQEDIRWVVHGGAYLQVPGSLMPATYQQSENTYPLQFDTTSGDLANLQISGIGDFDADGYDDVLTNTIRKSMDLSLTAPVTEFFNESALILYGSAEGLPRDLSPGVLSTERVSQLMHFGRLQEFTDVNEDGAADLTTDYPFSVYLGTPGHRYGFLLPGGTNLDDSYQLQGFEYGVDFGELIWNVSKKFVLVWQNNELVSRTETNSLMIPRDIDDGGTFFITPDFLGKDPVEAILVSDIREPLDSSNTVTILVDETCNSDGYDTREPVDLQTAGLNISWISACARTINIHDGNGNYLTTLPGDATEWTAAEPGDYFLVSTNSGNWTTWQRSTTVTVSTDR